jgi:hypothetical protein
VLSQGPADELLVVDDRQGCVQSLAMRGGVPTRSIWEGRREIPSPGPYNIPPPNNQMNAPQNCGLKPLVRFLLNPE